MAGSRFRELRPYCRASRHSKRHVIVSGAWPCDPKPGSSPKTCSPVVAALTVCGVTLFVFTSKGSKGSRVQRAQKHHCLQNAQRTCSVAAVLRLIRSVRKCLGEGRKGTHAYKIQSVKSHGKEVACFMRILTSVRECLGEGRKGTLAYKRQRVSSRGKEAQASCLAKGRTGTRALASSGRETHAFASRWLKVCH